jgi:hypothetical protein
MIVRWVAVDGALVLRVRGASGDLIQFLYSYEGFTGGRGIQILPLDTIYACDVGHL